MMSLILVISVIISISISVCFLGIVFEKNIFFRGAFKRQPSIHPSFLAHFNSTNRKAPGISILDNLATILVCLITIIPIYFNIKLLAVYFIPLFFISLSFLFSLLYRGAEHLYHYNQWIVNNSSITVPLLCVLKKKKPNEYNEVLELLSKGETRTLLLKYPDIYTKIGAPHLWNSVNNTKVTVWLTFLVIILLVVSLLFSLPELFKYYHILYSQLLDYFKLFSP